MAKKQFKVWLVNKIKADNKKSRYMVFKDVPLTLITNNIDFWYIDYKLNVEVLKQNEKSWYREFRGVF